MGFETGLREWRRLLAPGGHLALTEVCWTKADPPADCVAFWAQLYPAIRDVPSTLRVIGNAATSRLSISLCQRQPGGMSITVRSNRTLCSFVTATRGDRRAGPADRSSARSTSGSSYSEFYSYEFFVMRRT